MSTRSKKNIPYKTAAFYLFCIKIPWKQSHDCTQGIFMQFYGAQ